MLQTASAATTTANYGPGGWEFVDGASKIAAEVEENPLADLPYNHGLVAQAVHLSFDGRCLR